MRKSAFIGVLLAGMLLVDLLLGRYLVERHQRFINDQDILRMVVRQLGVTDLVITTEARYTRHPAVSDAVVPFMDHPADIEHFPSGSFYYPGDAR